MFTGIIEALGKVSNVEQRGGDVRLSVTSDQLDFSDVALGDSIACNGVCLTAVELLDKGFVADVSQETLAVTTAANWRAGTLLNLEKAMLASSRFGGHIVSGHVDAIATVRGMVPDARSQRIAIEVPVATAKYIAHKGSVCVDGTSLTVNEVQGQVFTVNIVPHTMEHTIMHSYGEGTVVNIEVDVIARYVERLHSAEQNSEQASTLSEAFLKEHGFC